MSQKSRPKYASTDYALARVTKAKILLAEGGFGLVKGWCGEVLPRSGRFWPASSRKLEGEISDAELHIPGGRILKLSVLRPSSGGFRWDFDVVGER